MSENQYTVLETYPDGIQLIQWNEEPEEKTCLFCGCKDNLDYLINDAWSVERLCRNCYDENEIECDDEGRNFEDWKKANGVEPVGDEE